MVTDDKRAIPLVLVDEAGVFLDAALINRKGLRKSLEHGSLWILHPETGRLLPYANEGEEEMSTLVGIEERGGYAVATLEKSVVGNGSRFADPGSSSTVRDDDADGERPDGTRSASGARAVSPTSGLTDDVISRLVAVIRDRRLRLPEGSYTTYLFREGSAKIRKKTGEEAVEVILSADRAELTRESADLIYHLLVLLVAEEISWEDVLAELAHRGR